MKDFTLTAYRRYLEVIKSSYPIILRFDEYLLSLPKPKRFCLIRHDVDRMPHRALEMAELEYEMGIQASYYFRAKAHTLKPAIIGAIRKLGHELGYHYESLSDTNGDVILALKDFADNLKDLREIAPIKTISMHGRPLKQFDNQDLWRGCENRSLYLGNHEILGEISLDIDYKEIAYISDTGRNWSSQEENIRDRVDSELMIDFQNGDELYSYLKAKPKESIVFQVHPERWSRTLASYYLSYYFDHAANYGKRIARLVHDR